jgi:hypothetical protein
MPETVIVDVSAEVASGPTVKESRTLTVDAYDKISVAVPDGTNGLTVELEPGTAGSCRFLVVTSNVYGDALTYKVNAGATAIALDQPLFLIGAGAASILGSPPTKLVFANVLGAGKDAQVQILIGRDATP